MARGSRSILISTILLALAVLIQSTLLHWVALRGVKPDLALIILIFISTRKGSLTGQAAGFISGLVEDFLSLSPLGFHAFVRTVVGFVYGLTVGSIFIDPILMPLVLVVSGTIMKGLISSLLVAVFSIPAAGFAVFTGKLWIEIGYNALLAPFIFALLSLFKSLKPGEREAV